MLKSLIQKLCSLKTVKYRKSLLLYALLLTYIGVRPIVKYYETIEVIPRINFTLIVILGLGIYGFYSISNLEKISIHKNGFRFFSLGVFLYIVIIQIVYLPNILANNIKFVDYLHVISETLFSSTLMWLIGSKINEIDELMKNHRVRRGTFILFILFVLTICIGIILKYKNNYGVGFFIFLDGAQNYLMIADSFAIFSILVLNYANGRKNKAFIFFVSVVCLYATLSRTSLYLYVFVTLVSMTVKKLKFKKNIKFNFSNLIFTITMSLILLILTIMFFDDISQRQQFSLDNNRMFILLVNRNSDVSALARNTIFEDGIKDIKSNLIFGDFMVEVKRSGTRGGYIHNYLSYWQQYGIIVFFSINIIIIYTLIKTFNRFVRNYNSDKIQFIFQLSLFIIMSAVFSRAYIYPYSWLVFSIASNFNLGEKNNEKSKCTNASF